MPVSSGPGIGSQMREVRAGWLQLTRVFKITAQCHNDVKKRGSRFWPCEDDDEGEGRTNMTPGHLVEVSRE